ncbi:MAG: ATP-binding protein, partial [bacterium]|nr:ATP-binding protein [bacterium]
MKKDYNFSWTDLFEVFKDAITTERKILVIDEFQYLGKVDKAFPSLFQGVWENLLQNENIMVILCGSLIRMMESQTLNYSSPLYGRRTGQIKLKQIDFLDYPGFFSGANKPNSRTSPSKSGFSEEELIETFAVTGGVPKYIEVFNSGLPLMDSIKRNILNKQSFLYEEPIFLLEKEVSEIGSYFSIIKAIAHGNHKLSKIATLLGVKQSSLTRYLQTLMELDLIRREIPVTETDPSKSKQGLYYITDNFIEFWFKFIYPFRSYLEMDDSDFVMKKIEKNFIDNHAAFVFERVCLRKMWVLNKSKELPFRFDRVGRWWDKNTEIDIVGVNEETREIILGECKYTEAQIDVNLFFRLQEKGKAVSWNRDQRKEYYILFSKTGYTTQLTELAAKR